MAEEKLNGNIELLEKNVIEIEDFLKLVRENIQNIKNELKIFNRPKNIITVISNEVFKLVLNNVLLYFNISKENFDIKNSKQRNRKGSISKYTIRKILVYILYNEYKFTPTDLENYFNSNFLFLKIERSTFYTTIEKFEDNLKTKEDSKMIEDYYNILKNLKQ